MAVRATKELMKVIFPDIDDELDVTGFIDASNALVDAVCLSSGYDAGRLTQIETWLAVHMMQIYDMPERFYGAGKVQGSFMSKVDLGLNLTHYGQTAMLLDHKGNLADLNKDIIGGKTVRPKLTYIGGDPCPDP